MLDFKELNAGDPLKRTVEKKTGAPEYSPMDPPSAYEPLAKESIPYENMHPTLKALVDEHHTFTQKLKNFEDVLTLIRKEGLMSHHHSQLRDFFEFFDRTIHPHGKKEEKELFPLLRQKLIEQGEHGPDQKTGDDLLEDDHPQALQLAAVSFNLLGLVSRLSNPKSQLEVLDLALTQAQTLVELMRLHIFRENEVIFPLAQKYLASELSR